MKQILTIVALNVMLGCCAIDSRAQTGINTTDPDPSSVLELNAIDKGMLYPRMTSVQRTAIASPAEGLLVYDTDRNRMMIFSGNEWNPFPRIDEIVSGSVTVAVQYDSLTDDMGGPQTLTIANEGVVYNPAAIVDENSSNQNLRFERGGTYEISIYALITRTNNDNSNISMELVSTSDPNKKVIGYMDFAYINPAANSFTVKGLLRANAGEEFQLVFTKLIEDGAGTEHHVSQAYVFAKLLN